MLPSDNEKYSHCASCTDILMEENIALYIHPWLYIEGNKSFVVWVQDQILIGNKYLC